MNFLSERTIKRVKNLEFKKVKKHPFHFFALPPAHRKPPWLKKA